MDELWRRVRAGRHTAVLGAAVGEPPAGIQVVRVPCDVPPTTLGPLHEARRKALELLGGEAALFEQARDRMVQGLRRRLLGDVPAPAMESALVEVWNRLARGGAEQPVALVFEAVDAADHATLAALRHLVGRPGWLKLPVVLAFRGAQPEGAAEALLATVRAVTGPDGILRADHGNDVERAAGPSVAPDEPVVWRALPPEVLRVLRAGALVGSGFEADLVAALLRVDLLDVLDVLQRAADLGVPVEDVGEQRFRLPEALLDALRASMLPSLMTAWHQRLAELLGSFDELDGTPRPSAAWPDSVRSAVSAPLPPSAAEPAHMTLPDLRPVEADVEPMEGFAPTRRAAAHSIKIEEAPAGIADDTTSPAEPPAPAAEVSVAAASRPAEAKPEEATPPTERGARHGERLAAPGPWPYAELFAGAGAPVVAAPPRSSAPAAPPAPIPRGVWETVPITITDASAASMRPRAAAPSRRVPAAQSPRADDARAAGHLAAAGDLDASAERYAAAARQAAEHGAHPQAFAYAEKALALLDALPAAPRRRRLRARVLLELGRLRWQAAGPAAAVTDGGPGFTLAGAVEALEAARAALGDDDPPELKAEVAMLIAGVGYDVGDLASLTRALDELAGASRLLLEAGDPTGAARLLNDQAAVYVRLGDPVRATHLLGESRRIFEERAATDPVAALEMAETDHLFARIPLHVAARPGREADALTMGLDHALAAERTYKRLDLQRELGRVWETMGRLELRKGRLERAEARLTAAVSVEEQSGDLVGLARSTAALSELLAASGRLRDALAVLSDSVALNFEKGSPIGLAFNRRALAALARAAGGSPEAAGALADVEARLDAAEAVLGKMKLPGERD